MDKYFIEQINVSDKDYKLTEITTNLPLVKQGDLIFSYESSKANYDVFAENDGRLYLNPAINLGESYEVGYIIAIVSDIELSKSQLDEVFIQKKNIVAVSSRISDQLITKKAQILIDKNKIDVDIFAELQVVNEELVLNYLNNNNLPKQESFNQLIIIGGRGGAKMIIEAVRSMGYFTIKGIIDDTLLINDEVMGVKVLGGQTELIKLHSDGYHNLVLSFTSLSNLTIRESKYHELKKSGFKFPNIIHRRATVEPSVKMGEGNIVLANAMVGSDVTLGDINFVNTGAIISHDTFVNANNHFAPNAVLAGRITIGKNNLFGMCSTVYFDTVIGDNNTIYNGVHIFTKIGNNKLIKNN
jgi:sugar O-acyltransferase (sialic acid O-acetyltransferase NeuD family)